MTLIKVTVESTSSTTEEKKVEAKSTESKSLSWHSMNGFDVTAVLTTLTSHTHTHTIVKKYALTLSLCQPAIMSHCVPYSMFYLMVLALAGWHRKCLHCQRMFYALVTCKVFWINRQFNSTSPFLSKWAHKSHLVVKNANFWAYV